MVSQIDKSICLSTPPPLDLLTSTVPPIHLSSYLHMPVCLSVYLRLSVRPSVRLAVYLSLSIAISGSLSLSFFLCALYNITIVYIYICVYIYYFFLKSRTAVPQVHPTPEVWPHPGASSSARVATFAAVQRVQKTWIVALCAVSLLSSRRMSTCLETEKKRSALTSENGLSCWV